LYLLLPSVDQPNWHDAFCGVSIIAWGYVVDLVCLMKILDGIVQRSATTLCDLNTWSQEWQIDCVGEELLAQDGLYLIVDADQVSLQQGGRKAPGPVFVDFVSGASAHRRKFGGGRGQSIAKAVGINSAYIPTVLDATAGLGRDAFVLATLGCNVTLIERHPVVCLLLKSGLQRAKGYIEIADIMARMSLVEGNSIDLLANWLTLGHDQPDIVYLDPMFPHTTASAEAKKEMKLFRSLVGADVDEDKLWARADALARCRIVVKRPAKAPPLAGKAPSYVLAGKANRFDIYVKAKVAAITAAK
jgi:16S rRNA (guanine1516-N2)-methyltransferase